MTTQTTTEEKFVRDIINVTTGWAIAGSCKTHEEALRKIQQMCEHRLWERNGLPG